MSALAQLLEYAVSVNASDIHLVSGQAPIFRQYGHLVEGGDEIMEPDTLLAIIDEILPQHLLEIFHREHECDFSLQEPGVGRFRANAFMEMEKPSLALRKVNTDVPTFEELGLPAVLGKLSLSKSGIIMATGSTGCGKSTTVARMLQHINEHQSRRIITIEDPIEFVFHDEKSIILQREIGSDTMSWERALRSALRQDPDVVMVGEMRDAESFAAALSMAETGHLVLTTLHTDTASQSVTRILNFFRPDQRDVVRMALSVNLRAVLCQRMLHNVDNELVPACEIMINTPLVGKIIETNALDRLSSAIETGRDDGMQTFNQHIYDMIQAGIITEDEGRSHATNPAALDMLLSGINLHEDKRII